MFDFRKNALTGAISGQALCGEYSAAWRACGDDKERLVSLALKQQSIPYIVTACYQNLGLSKEYILGKFGDFINGKRVINDADGVEGYKYELYVAFDGIFKPVCDVLSLMWCNYTSCDIQACKSPVIYISCNSDVHLTLDGYNSPHIYLFDDSRVTIDEADEESKVVIYRYSENAEVVTGKYCLAKVTVFDKQLRL